MTVTLTQAIKKDEHRANVVNEKHTDSMLDQGQDIKILEIPFFLNENLI